MVFKNCIVGREQAVQTVQQKSTTNNMTLNKTEMPIKKKVVEAKVKKTPAGTQVKKTATKKMTKKELKLQKIAIGNKKMAAWIKLGPKLAMGLSTAETVPIPQLELEGELGEEEIEREQRCWKAAKEKEVDPKEDCSDHN